MYFTKQSMDRRFQIPDSTRFPLGILLLLVAINAFAGGYYGMAGAKNVPVEWLEGSPFHDYFIPSLILFSIVGGTSLAAGIMVLKQKQSAGKLALISSIVILSWLLVQILIIGYVSWMQPATAFAAVLILVLTFQIKNHAW